jgi:pimeloyl-ACP methyl ester carboxylesterase
MAAELARVRRGFVDIDEGQVHYRTAGEGISGVPLVMFHIGYFSSKSLEPLIARLGTTRRVIAFDILSHGDSCAPAIEAPAMAYFADAHMRAIDAMGLGQFDLYGNHSGTRLAMEITITRKDRVRRLILDATSLFDARFASEYVSGVKPFLPDQEGAHILRLWQCTRDFHLFFPWDQRVRKTRRDIDLPDADTLHDLFLELAKGARTWHQFYRASLNYPNAERLPLVGVPTLVSCSADDMLMPFLEDVAALVPGSRLERLESRETVAGYDSAAVIFASFLDG